MTYEEKLQEVQKPIYKDSAKVIIDMAFSIFKDNLEPNDIYQLSLELLINLIDEYRLNLNESIFDIIELSDKTEKERFVQNYINLISKDKIHKESVENQIIVKKIHIICEQLKLNSLLTCIKEVVEKIGYKNISFVFGGYISTSWGNPDINFDYLIRYTRSLNNKEVIKVPSSDSTIWKLQHNGEGLWENEDDIILNNISYVWSPSCGYARFLDINGKWGFINVIDGRMHYMPENIVDLRDYYYGRAAYKDKETGLYGFVDKDGNVIICPKYIKVMDFMMLGSEQVAVVQLSADEKYKLSHDFNRKTRWGEPMSMNISIFRNPITINLNGDFTPDIQKVYNEEIRRYNDKVTSEEIEKQMYLESKYQGDDEEDIMNALTHGCGDIYGF